MNQRKYMVIIKAEKLIQLTSSEHLSGFHSSKIKFLLCQFQLLQSFPAQLFLTCQLQRLTILLVSQLSNPVKSNPTTPQIFDFPRNHFSTQKSFCCNFKSNQPATMFSWKTPVSFCYSTPDAISTILHNFPY